VTGLLLSLGAPFWYNSLGRLLQLRSVLAVKDDRQRAGRQGFDPGTAPAAVATAAAATTTATARLPGERGDLTSAG
jgi:hypothetical protein